MEQVTRSWPTDTEPFAETGDGTVSAEQWSFDGRTGQVVRVTAGSDAFDTVVSLLSPSGEELARDNDGGPGTDSQLEAALPATGRYVVDVTAYNDTGSGPYQVAVRTVPVRPLEEVGAGEVTAEGGGNYWSFEGEAGQVVRITAGSDAFDTVVRLLSDDGGRGTDSQLEAVLPAAGRYLVRVGALGIGTGLYQVAVRTVPVRPLEEVGAGEVTAEGGGNYWSFEGEAGQVVRITAGSDAFDTVVRLLSPGGEELALDDDGGLGTDSQLEATLPAAGRYLVDVAAYDGTGTYQVAMRTGPVRPLEGAGTGEITAEGGWDYWSFDGAAGQVVRITAGSDAFDTEVRLRSPGGEELARDDDGGLGTDSQLEATLPAAGLYLVRVGAYTGTGTGPYQVAMGPAPVRPLEEVGAGEVTAEGGGEYWSFEGEAGQVVRITAGSDAFDTEVRLRSPGGEELARDNDGGLGTDSQLEAALPAAGLYLVRVGAYTGTGPYQVAMRTGPVRPLEGAGTGEITAEGGWDYWSFEGEAGQVVRITAGSDAFDTEVRLRSPGGEELARDDDGGLGTDSQLEATLPAAGLYLVRVGAYTGTGTGPYQVAMGPAPVRPLEEVGAGEVTAEGGGEYWSFEGEAGQVVRITAGSDAFDTEVRLRSPGGEELARDNDGGLGTDSQLEATLPAAGLYLVRVGAYTGTGPYQVAMRTGPVRPLEGAGTGEITAEGGWDYWSFDGAAGQVVRITAGSDAFDTVVRLLSPGGEELARDDDGGLGTDSQLEATLPAAGRYLVDVAAYDGTGTYQVAVRSAPVRPLTVDDDATTGEFLRR